MDPGLLRHYNDELAHLREVGAEFARQFPKIASRLTMDGIEVADPYVERLIEGFAFLAARTQLKIEAEYPRFIQHLLEVVYPNAVSPVPSMLIVRMQADLNDPGLVTGFSVPRGSALQSTQTRGQGTRCDFRSAHAVTMWPVELAGVQYFSHAPDLPITQLPLARQVRGGLRIKLRAHGGARFDQLPLDELSFYISAPDDIAFRLHELVFGSALGTLCVGPRPAGGAAARACWRGTESVQEVGYGDDEALLPQTLRGFSGHRLLQELAAMPQRLLFFKVSGLRERLAQVNGTEATLALLFGRGDAGLESVVDNDSLALYCTPAINLFPKRLDRIQLGTGTAQAEYHVVPDRTRPMDFEVFSLESVTGYGTGQVTEQPFLPLYSAYHTESPQHAGYYTVRREPRLLSQRQREHGTRSAYIGTEVFVALVDPNSAPYREDVRQLSINAWVTNRDLPTLLPGAGRQDAARSEGGAAAPARHTWTLDTAGPVHTVESLRGPTRPIVRLPRGQIGWNLINLLSVNYLSIAGEDPQRAAAALRSLLALQCPQEDANWRKQVDGVHAVRAQRVTRRLPFPGPMTFGTGVHIDVEVDELAFQGASAFLLGCVLERFFARHASLNSFTETTLRTASRGVILQGRPRVGALPLI